MHSSKSNEELLIDRSTQILQNVANRAGVSEDSLGELNFALSSKLKLLKDEKISEAVKKEVTGNIVSFMVQTSMSVNILNSIYNPEKPTFDKAKINEKRRSTGVISSIDLNEYQEPDVDDFKDDVTAKITNLTRLLNTINPNKIQEKINQQPQTVSAVSNFPPPPAIAPPPPSEPAPPLFAPPPPPMAEEPLIQGVGNDNEEVPPPPPLPSVPEPLSAAALDEEFGNDIEAESDSEIFSEFIDPEGAGGGIQRAERVSIPPPPPAREMDNPSLESSNEQIAAPAAIKVK